MDRGEIGKGYARRSSMTHRFLAANPGREIPERHWRPATDVYRAPHGWVIKLDLAGVNPDDIAVQVAGPLLTVSGVRRDTIIREGWSHYSMEISYSRFERAIELPFDPAGCRIRLEYREGMLLIHLESRGGLP
jgi:HSP20 family protein